MQYQSTRGGGSFKTFEEVLVATYAVDGGLYVPCKLPLLTLSNLIKWKSYTFPQVCAEIVHLFSGIDIDSLNVMTSNAFHEFNGGTGNDPLPITKVNDLYLLDASLGPTFAFKDIGQQMVGQLLNYVLAKQSKMANILVETSGDTGPAAIAAVKKCSNVNIFCLYPHQRVSVVQELQMITVDSPNVHVYRSEGDSDEQASLLKEIFSDGDFIAQHNICSVNSINWVRIAVQSSYYVWAYLHVVSTRMGVEAVIGKQCVNFVVPSGAFGNAMGGFLAKRMGLPIDKLVCATNANDIVHRVLSTGDMHMGTNVKTASPAMDIQFAYNLERMLYYVCNENPEVVRPIMEQAEAHFANMMSSADSAPSAAAGVQLDGLIVSSMHEHFVSCSVSDAETLQTMKEMNDQHGILLCPHSAIGVNAATHRFVDMCQNNSVPSVCVLTAHPVKFESTVLEATQRSPELPESVQLMKTLPHKFKELKRKCGEDQSWRVQWITTLKNDIAAVAKQGDKSLVNKEVRK